METLVRLTKQQIIKETAEFYGKDPVGRRASTTGNSCRYYMEPSPKHPEPRMCALGRCLINAVMHANTAASAPTLNQCYTDGKGLDSILKEEYRGHSVRFWNRLQSWHDTGAHFDLEKNCISPNGQSMLERLLDLYKDNGEPL